MAKKRKNKRMRKRRWFTATERVEVWDRWQRGESSQSIGRVLVRGGSAIHRQLAVYGGIRPQSRCRSSRALTLVEREDDPPEVLRPKNRSVRLPCDWVGRHRR